LNWKSVATIVKRAVEYGLKHRTRPPVHVIGIDEVSRRKGQVYLTVVYDLERRVLLWVGDDRTEEAVRPFFTKEMGTRRCHTLRVICMDMWAAYANLVKEHAPQAQILFDRFHIVKHLNEAVEEVRRSEMRRLSQKEKVPFKRSRWLLLKNPWNLSDDQKERLSTLVRWNAPIVRAYYLKEAFQLFWDYRQPKRAGDHLEKWMRSAMRSRLEPFKKFVRMLRGHLDGVLVVDQAPGIERRRRGHEQQDQVHQPSLVRVPDGGELHRGDLSLLCEIAAPPRTLITLLG
jgi:transposase